MKSFNGGLAVHSKKQIDIWGILIGFALIVFSLICLLPFVHVVAKSFSQDAYVIANKVFLWPLGFNTEAYKKIFADQSILRSFYISVTITVLFTLIGMVITILAAYALSRPQLRWRAVLTMIFTFPLFFHGGIIPEYMMINNLGMLDTVWSLILPLAFSSFNLIIMKSALKNTIPISLEGQPELTVPDTSGYCGALCSPYPNRLLRRCPYSMPWVDGIPIRMLCSILSRIRIYGPYSLSYIT